MSPLHFFKLKCRSTIQASSGRIQSDVSVAPKLLERNVSQNCGVEGDPHNFFYDDHPSVANGSLDFNELQGEQDQSSISPFASALNKMERLEGTLRYVLPRCARYQNEAIFDKYYDGIEDNSEDNVSTTDSIINCISSQDKLSNVPEIGGESIEGCMKQKTLEQTINEIVTLAKELPNLAKETSLADWGLDEIVCFQAMTEWELIPQFIRGDMKKIAALNFIRCPVDCLGCSKEFIGSDCEFTCFGWKIVHLERWLEEDVSEKELSFWWIESQGTDTPLFFCHNEGEVFSQNEIRGALSLHCNSSEISADVETVKDMFFSNFIVKDALKRKSYCKHIIVDDDRNGCSDRDFGNGFCAEQMSVYHFKI